MHNDWAYNERQHVPIWDTRGRKTRISACQRLAQQPEISFSRALGSQRKAVSRIMHHEKTPAEDLLAGHVRAANLRCQHQDFVRVASDTTVCDFTTHKATEGLGAISSKPHQKGFLLHSALALTPDGMPLALLHQQSGGREAAPVGDTDQPPERRAFEDKESHQWLAALRGVEAALPKHQQALLVQDREADVFAFFAAPRREGFDLLIRAAPASPPQNERRDALPDAF